MKRFLQSLIVATVCGASLFHSGPARAQVVVQDPYWGNHWRWHNNVYRPYYYRYYSPTVTAPPVYSNGPYYNPGYVHTPGYSYTPGYGYTQGNYYGRGVTVGPMRFGWW